jgi:RHS repeat-associated protein
VKFATYTRDSATGLDYADQRYYASTFGRFMTPDPAASSNVAEPASWIKYPYVVNDPINYYDPEGLIAHCPPNTVVDNENGGCKPAPWTQVTLPNVPHHVFTVFEYDDIHGKLQQIPRIPIMSTLLAISLKNAVNRAVIALTSNSECRALFGINADPASVLQSMLNHGEYGSIDFRALQADRAAEATYGSYADGEYVTASIQINNIAETGYWAESSVDQNARTLIHELGHVFNIIAKLGGSKFEYDADPVTGAPVPDVEARNRARENTCIH